MHSRLALCLSLAILAISLSALPALAHHGWGGNADQEFELTGTVESSVSLAGPHATMKIKADGKIWDITMAPPARTERAGLKDGPLVPVDASRSQRPPLRRRALGSSSGAAIGRSGVTDRLPTAEAQRNTRCRCARIFGELRLQLNIKLCVIQYERDHFSQREWKDGERAAHRE